MSGMMIPARMTPKTCPNCVHHHYEENEEEIELGVCFLRRKLVKDKFQAATCPDYYTGRSE